MKKKKIFLIDLPTFPKGVMSLTFPSIAACLPKKYAIQFIDLNLVSLNKSDIRDFEHGSCLFVGMKVSCQNYLLAIELTASLKYKFDHLKIIWGGEYPSLLPREASEHADAIVVGVFETIAERLIDDLEKKRLQKIYKDDNKLDCLKSRLPNYSIFTNPNLYSQVMGFPMETSKGCDKKCTFCLVHTMQGSSHFKNPIQLKEELNLLKGRYVNVIDYNIGSNIKHLHNVIDAFTNSETLGWMGEMCLETLDNEALLEALARSRCRIIYCGLESIDEASLISINKAKTNNIENYARIIKMAHKYGIQIAAGIIIGLEGATKETITSTFKFYQTIGVIYAKLTFLTYNPGTKVHESMKRVGKYVHEELHYFDGNHFTYVPHGVNRNEVLTAVKKNIKLYYSLRSIQQRAKNAGAEGLVFDEFVQFNLSYRNVYLSWLKCNIFEDEKGFEKLLLKKYRKSKANEANDKAIMHTRLERNKPIA